MSRTLSLVSCLLLLAGCSALDAINPFSRSGPKMGELQPIQATAQARIAWQENVGKSDIYVLAPAIVGSSVYVAGKGGTLVRLDDGQTVWKINVGQAISGGVGADRTLVAVGTPKGEILAFAQADGKPLWQARATSEILSPPAPGEGLVVVRSGDHRLAAYDALDGQRKWLYQRPLLPLSLRSTAQPLRDERYVFAGFPGGKLVALNLATGVALWEGTVTVPKGATELERAADVASAPVISGRTVCAAAFQGKLSCFDLQNGRLLWSRELSSTVGLSIDGRVLYVTDDKDAVFALDLTSGASLWKQDKLARRGVTAPLPVRDFIAVADAEGYVHFLSRADGSFAARLPTDGTAIVAPLQTLGRHVLAQSSGGGVFAIEIE